MHLLFTSFLLLGLLTSNANAQVWVITDSHHPVTGNASVQRLIQLDAAQQIETELSVNLFGSDSPPLAA